MNQVHFINDKCSSRKVVSDKIAKTKVDNSLKEIKTAVAELETKGIAVTQAKVIRRLKGKRCRKTVIHHWKTLFPKNVPAQEVCCAEEPYLNKPFHQWTNEELGIPTLQQEKILNPAKSEALLFCYLQVMREMRIQELQKNFNQG